MTINNPEAFVASHWDWACLDGCFGASRIRPTDIDGLVEHHGQFLILEAKLPGVLIPKGQELTFLRVVKDAPFHVFVIWGHPGEPEEIRVLSSWEDYTKSIDLRGFQKMVSNWYEWAHLR